MLSKYKYYEQWLMNSCLAEHTIQNLLSSNQLAWLSLTAFQAQNSDVHNRIEKSRDKYPLILGCDKTLEVRKYCDTSRGVLSTIAHTAASAVDCGRNHRDLQSGLMNLSMALSAVSVEKWAVACPFIRSAPQRAEEAHCDCLSMYLSGYMSIEPC